MAGPNRKDMWRVSLTVNGVDWGVWDVKTGGEVDSESTSYKPGDMEDQISLGGPVTTGNVTLNRLYRQERDHANIQKLINGAGGAAAVVKQQPLDSNKLPFGKPIVYSGTLKRVTPPDVDSNSVDAALIEVEVNIAGKPVAA